jgi:hypothetical protein
VQAVGVKTLKPVGADCCEGDSFHFELPSSTTFEAKVSKGYFHGKCSVSFADGVCAEVFFAKNTICGPGVISYHDARYHGYLHNGLHHGSGTLEVIGGDFKYEGKMLGILEGHNSTVVLYVMV